ncbi:MAG: hypothetical protein WDN69_32470 [Aliidongia sp.]
MGAVEPEMGCRRIVSVGLFQFRHHQAQPLGPGAGTVCAGQFEVAARLAPEPRGDRHGGGAQLAFRLARA